MMIYSYVARYISFIFLLAQSALVVEVAVDLHDVLRLQVLPQASAAVVVVGVGERSDE